MRVRSRAGLAVALLLLALSAFHFVRSAHESRAHGFVDFPIFLAQARLFLLTGELYLDPANPEAFAPAAAVYKFPPLYAMLLLPLVRSGVDSRVYVAHWGLQVLLYAAAVGLLLRYLRSLAGPGFVLAGVLLALNFEPFFETAWRLQIETPLLLLLVLGLVAYLERREVSSGVTLGVGFMLKLYPAFLLLHFVVRRRLKVLVGFAVSVALILAATWVVIGAEQTTAYFLRVLPVLLGEDPEMTTENVGIGRYLLAFPGVSPRAAKRIGQALVLPLIVVTLLALHRGRPREDPERLTRALEFSLFVPLMLLAMPNSWVNYQLLLLLPLLVLCCHVSRGAREATGTALLAGLAYLPLLFYWPCAEASVSWPCARTPYFLGMVQLPRSGHDLMVALRGVSAFLIWAALLSARVHGGGDATPSGAGHRAQPEALDGGG